MFNLLLGLTTPQKRAQQVAIYAMLIAVPNIIAPLIGGIIADYGTLWIIHGIPLVFLTSFIVRLFTSVLVYTIHEPRAKKTYTITHVFHNAFSLHPSRGIEYKLRSVVKKFNNKYGILR